MIPFFLRKRKLSLPWIFGGVLLGLASISVGPSWAKTPVFSTPPEGFRGGMELELLPQALAKIMGYFDFDDFQSRTGTRSSGLDPSFFDDYLRDSNQALAELPDEVRKKLTEGLKLEDTLVHRSQSQEAAPKTATKLILPGSIQETAKPPVISPVRPAQSTSTGGILLSPAGTDYKGGNFQMSGELALPKTAAWQTLYDRWKTLPFEEKAKLSRWENLSASKKAQLAIKFSNFNLKAKPDLPPEEKHLFDRLYWSRDGEAMEFRHREDLVVSDPKEFYDDVLLLAKRAGVDLKITDPEQFNAKIKSGGLHFHISQKGRDLREQTIAWNRLALVRRVNQGVLNDLTRQGSYLYTEDIDRKGLVRAKATDRMEFRAHNIPLADELELIIKTLNQSDNEALHTINAEIKKLMTPYVVEKFIKYQPFLMTEFLKDFDPKEAAQVLLKLLDSDSLENGDPLQSQRREAAIDYLRKTHEWPEEIWSHVPTILSHGDNTLKMGILTALSSKANWPKPVWGEIVNLLNTQNPELLNKVSFSLMQSTKWPEEVWAKIPALLMKPSSEPIMPQLIMGIERQGAWPESFWKHVPEIMESPIHNGPLNFLALLRNQDPWPQEVWAKIPAMMQKADTDVQQALATALRSKAIWPQSVWDELLHGNFEHMSREKVLGLMLKSGAFKELNSIPIEIWRALPKYLQSKEYDLRSAAFKFLNAQQAWPKEFWNEVPALLRNPLPPVQESMVFALEKQGNWPLRVRALVSQLAKKGDWSVMHASEHVLKAQPKMKPSLCLLFYLKLMK